MKRFKGDNPYNNRVKVDFKNNTVTFEPVTEESQFFSFFSAVSIFSAYLFVIFFISSIIIVGFNTITADYMFYSGIGLCTLIPIFSIILYNNKWFVENYYPKVNYYLNKVITFGTIHKKYKIYPDNLSDKMMIIPSFLNVGLKYHLTEDFSKYIKHIDIKEHFYKKDDTFYCIFKFNRTPKTGYMEVEYI